MPRDLPVLRQKAAGSAAQWLPELGFVPRRIGGG